MKIACDLCGRAVEDSLLQIFEENGKIEYVCPECYLSRREHPPEERP